MSDELFLNFFDTDEEIELRTGASIDWIFDLEGEEGFRKRESDILDEMVQKNSIVLSTGGGIVLSDKNRELYHQEEQYFFYQLQYIFKLKELLKIKIDLFLKMEIQQKFLQNFIKKGKPYIKMLQTIVVILKINLAKK